MDALHGTPRRRFLRQSAALAGSLVVGLRLPEPAWAVAATGGEQGRELNAWVIVRPDDTVIVRVARSEMGQGIFTSLPMLVAEELECDWRKVRPEFASTSEELRRHRIFVTMATGGSRSVRDSTVFLRQAGATARQMLVAAAAKRWGVAPAECHADDGVIRHAPSGRSLRYGEVAGAAATMTVPKEVALKDPKDWKLIGKPVARLDLPDKVTGKPIFGIDARVPGMVYGAVVQCPVFGGKLKRVDEKSIAGRRGIVGVVPLDSAAVVLADNSWRAQHAADALRVEWDSAGNGGVGSAGIAADFRAGLKDPNLAVARNDGDVDRAFAGADRVLEAEYSVPFLAHATMEPQNCTAWVREGRVDIWVPTQNSEASLPVAAIAADVPLAYVEVHKTFLGGGFGRRGAFQDFVRQAVLASKKSGRPVKLLWSREQDTRHDYYRPASIASMKAGLDAQGMPVAWQTRIACPSILAKLRPMAVENGIDPLSVSCFTDMPYAIPNLRVAYALRHTPVPVGFWRSVGHSQNPFFRECFLDEMAQAGGHDPYQLRRRLLANSPRDLAVLDAAARGAGWDTLPPKGVYRGIAVQDGYGSYTAAVIEASVSDAGEVKLHRVVIAIDPGYVVNPDTARAQAEGCVAYALSAALWGEITIKDGRVQQSNFNDYPVMRMKDTPPIEVLLVPSGGFWGGIGEPPMAPLAPALCNALFAATGKRIRSLPIRKTDLRR